MLQLTHQYVMITMTCIDDMHISSNQMSFVHFAVNTTVFAPDSDINNVHASVNRELVGVDNWLKTNRQFL